VIEPTDETFQRIDRLLGRAEVVMAALAACLLVALVVVIA
jgi:hypothetical protein